jgi:carbon-monoxide dehydrogenase large subunit
VGDIVLSDMLHACIVRSPHAHARIGAIRTDRAASAAGVVAVFTGDDMAADGVGPMRAIWEVRGSDGRAMAEPPRWALARGAVHHVGQAVAVVVAASAEAAVDAAEQVEIQWDPLPVVVSSRDAIRPGAPQLHPEAPGNVCFRWARGDEAAVRQAFQRAAHVVAVDIVNQRITGAAIEPRCAIGVAAKAEDGLTLYSSTQIPHQVRRLVAMQLAIDEVKLRVIAPDVGGGFGYKGKHYPEETIVTWAARRLGRPIKWVATRSESFVSDLQARDHLTHAELAVDGEGRFLGLRVETLANLGAYISHVGAGIPSAIYTALLAGVYRTPAIRVEVTGIFTNTLCTDAYRGAGRPEACYVLERLADRAARVLGIDRVEIRRRNLIPRTAMPYKTPIGPTYDCGDFPKMLGRALEAAEYASFPERRQAAAQRGRLRGLGIACYVESSGVAPSRLAGAMGARVGFFESAQVRVDPGGGVRALLGTHNHGQGHATTFAQILADRLGVPLFRIEVVEGDTALVPFGTGMFGSRSIAVGGSALGLAAGKVIAKGRKIAAHLMEAAEADVDFRDGSFGVVGTDRRLSFATVAAAAHTAHDLPAGVEPGLDETAFYDPKNFAFSNGAHVCEVEIDPETADLRIVGYWVVDDVGVVINPMIVEGQVHGGLAQGIGQAVMEACTYDEGGQLLSASLMDHAIPRADQLPAFASELDESEPCTHNPLGAKGCGESGTIGAPAAVVSAVLDAVAPLGIDDVPMPVTPARLWPTIDAARARGLGGGPPGPVHPP